MSRYASVIAMCVALLAALPALSAEQLPLRFVTVDGTWDCKDNADAYTGTIVLVETAYAFVKTDGKLGGYGRLNLLEGDYDFPKFVVVDGYLKDEMKVIGVSMRGPPDDPEDQLGEFYLFGVVGFDGKRQWWCTRRGGRANAPPADL